MGGGVRRVRRPARRWAASWAALAVVLSGAAACTDHDKADAPGGDDPGSSASDRAQEPIETTVDHVSGHLNGSQRSDLKSGVNEAVDGWFDGAFLGDFPRGDYTGAFQAFTKGARKAALADLKLMSNQQIEDRIESSVAGNRRVRLDVLAPKGKASGVTAHFVLDFFTHGDLEDHRRVRGALYLTTEEGQWRIFGYDVAGAESR